MTGTVKPYQAGNPVENKEETSMKKNLYRLACLLLVFSTALSAMALGASAAEQPVSSGIYNLNQGSSRINVYTDKVSQIQNNTKINLYEANGGDATQQFRLERQSNGSYKISTMRENYTLNLTSLKSGASVICYRDTVQNTEYFLIQPLGSGYSIRPKNAPAMALTATGGSGLALQKYTGASSQSFQLRAVGTASSGVAGTINGVFQAAQTAVQAGERIALPVTRLSTTDSRWKNFEYDQGATIGKYGCLITCLAAFLNCTEDASYRPDTLAKQLTFRDGSLLWGYGPAQKFQTVSYSLSNALSQLREGNPVLVSGKGSTGQHWCVITGVDRADKQADLKSSQFTIMDPSFSSHRTLKDFLADYGSSLKMVVLK